jgi:TubC N-terminal docking domain
VTAIQTLFKVRRCGVTLVPNGDRLRFHPASALTPELVEELRQHKESILQILARQGEDRQDTSPRIGDVSEVLELARERFGPVEDPITLPAPRGPDPMARRTGDKADFFSHDRWRESWPRDFTVYRGRKA